MKLTVTFALVLLVSILTVVVTASHHPSITDNDRSYTRVRLTVTESLIQQFMQARLKAAGDHSIVYNLTATSDPKITEGFQTALLEYFDGRVLQSAHRNDDGSIGRDEPCRSLRDNCHVRTYNISHQVRTYQLHWLSDVVNHCAALRVDSTIIFFSSCSPDIDATPPTGYYALRGLVVINQAALLNLLIHDHQRATNFSSHGVAGDVPRTEENFPFEVKFQPFESDGGRLEQEEIWFAELNSPPQPISEFESSVATRDIPALAPTFVSLTPVNELATNLEFTEFQGVMDSLNEQFGDVMSVDSVAQSENPYPAVGPEVQPQAAAATASLSDGEIVGTVIGVVGAVGLLMVAAVATTTVVVSRMNARKRMKSLDSTMMSLEAQS